MTMLALDAVDARLLNDWQRGFPLVREPYAEIARTLETPVQAVLARLERLHRRGACSRIGGTWAAGAGGAALLCAYAVPPPRLDEVAAIVSAHHGVNHNYEREHRFNLWFVVTGADAADVGVAVDALDARVGERALRLAMQRAYRIDLGFDLRRRVAEAGGAAQAQVRAVAPADRRLAAWLEGGLPLVERPYDVGAAACGRGVDDVLATLRGWLEAGTLRRLGVVVRHHELGFAHNAMTVFDVPDAEVDRCGECLAAQPGVTLAYRRSRDARWPYNLYAMVHGRDRDEVCATIDAAARAAGLDRRPRERLFSRRRFKQQGGRYFAGAPATPVGQAEHAAG